MKKQEIVSSDWKNLIILDACRYDTFKKIYPNYLEGKLEKRISKGSNTLEWLKENFTEKYDITYYSSNPFINSKGIDWRGWNAIDHFDKVVDIWDSDWNEEYNTVLPEDMVKYLKQPSKKRRIFHFVQPHYPYLHPDFKQLELNLSGWGGIKNPDKKSFGPTLKKKIKNIFKGIVGDEKSRKLRFKTWKINDFFNIEPKDYFEKIYKNNQLERVPEFYEYNLKVALESIEKSVGKKLNKTIITSDHGELLGENNLWGHFGGSENRILKTVPWFEIL